MSHAKVAAPVIARIDGAMTRVLRDFVTQTLILPTLVTGPNPAAAAPCRARGDRFSPDAIPQSAAGVKYAAPAA